MLVECVQYVLGASSAASYAPLSRNQLQNRIEIVHLDSFLDQTLVHMQDMIVAGHAGPLDTWLSGTRPLFTCKTGHGMSKIHFLRCFLLKHFSPSKTRCLSVQKKKTHHVLVIFCVSDDQRLRFHLAFLRDEEEVQMAGLCNALASHSACWDLINHRRKGMQTHR